jgi:hypothetical protein
MAYVPGFKWDIFINYPMEAEEWARQFEHDLRAAPGLASIPGLTTYFAKRNWELGQVSDEMLDAARQSALFVAVLTEGSLAEAESRFLGLEMKAFRESGSIGGRFCPIPLFPVAGSQLSALMPSENAQAFWNTNLEFFYREDDVPLWLRPDSELEKGSYRKRVEKASWFLKNRLNELRTRLGGADKLEARGPFSGRTVLLGQKEPNVEAEWNAVRELLRNDGVTVLGDDDCASEDFAAALLKADLFVQLLSPLDPTDRAKEQFAAVAARGSVPILQWRRQINPKLLERMDEDDRRLFDGSHVLAVGLEEFKRAIRDKLKQLANPPPPVKTGDKPFVYIAADSSDLPLAREIQAAARKEADVDVMAEEESKRVEDFDGGLKQATAVVFLYGGAERKFINWWLKQYMRKTRLWKVYPKLTALYYAPPKKDTEQEPLWGVEELRTVGSQEKFSLEPIDQICAELRGAGA